MRGARPAGTGSGQEDGNRIGVEAGIGEPGRKSTGQTKPSEPHHAIDRQIQATEGVPRRALISPFSPNQHDAIEEGQELAPASRRVGGH